jgi:hypothetical protein
VSRLSEGQNLNFAVPASLVRKLINSPRAGYSHGTEIAIEESRASRREPHALPHAPAPLRKATVAAASKDKTYGLMEVVTGKPLFETIGPEKSDDEVS